MRPLEVPENRTDDMFLVFESKVGFKILIEDCDYEKLWVQHMDISKCDPNCSVY